jgi:hypothetical protein
MPIITVYISDKAYLELVRMSYEYKTTVKKLVKDAVDLFIESVKEEEKAKEIEEAEIEEGEEEEEEEEEDLEEEEEDLGEEEEEEEKKE